MREQSIIPSFCQCSPQKSGMKRRKCFDLSINVKHSRSTNARKPFQYRPFEDIHPCMEQKTQRFDPIPITYLSVETNCIVYLSCGSWTWFWQMIRGLRRGYYKYSYHVRRHRRSMGINDFANHLVGHKCSWLRFYSRSDYNRIRYRGAFRKSSLQQYRKYFISR